MRAVFEDKEFFKDLMNIAEYSEGFLQGIQAGKNQFLKSLGKEVIFAMKEFIDANARVNPAALQHVYEWYQNGNAKYRLYKLNYRPTLNGLTFNYTFSQSKSIKDGSNVPFYDKAKIMENGIPVTIKPTSAKVLAFEIGGEQIFTPNQVIVNNPGGEQAQGGFEHVFNSFFNDYFSQSFLKSSGIMEYLGNPDAYKKNLSAGKKGGKSEGIKVGYSWIIKTDTLGVL